LHKGKRNAQAAYDLNNTRQIIMAAQMYAGDNDDYLPQPGWGTRVACWAAGADIPPGGKNTFELYTNALNEQLASFHNGQLYSWIKSDQILRCPADNVIDAQFLQRNIYFCSYVWNAAILGFPDRPLDRPLPVTFKLRQFRPEAIMQWEADDQRPYCFDDFSAYPDEGITSRHDNGTTVGRFDGGAERMTVGDFLAHSGAIAADISQAGRGWRDSRIPAPNRLWCSPQHHGVPDDSDDETGP
jgi:hypothetical protein